MLLKYTLIVLILVSLCPCQLQGNYLNDLINGVGQLQSTSQLATAVFKQLGSWLVSNQEMIRNAAGQLVASGLDSIPNNVTSTESAARPISAMLGVCLPETCSNADVTGLVKTILDQLPENMTKSLPKAVVQCQENSLELTDKAKAVIGVCGFFVALIVAATAYDVVIVTVNNKQKKADKNIKLSNGQANGHINFVSVDTLSHISNGNVVEKVDHNDTKSKDAEKAEVYEEKSLAATYKPGKFGQILLSFSIYTNAPKILIAKQPAGSLTCINGVRFLSMTWVILGHTLGFGINMTENTAFFFTTMLKRVTFQAIANATISVDTFFVISGLLVSYLSLKEMKKQKGPRKFNWFMFYFHRFWRLTPPYMLFLMMYVPTIKYWASGPVWTQNGVESDECEDTWWTNLLYINNLYKEDKMCMGWSWYLANDMQFYVISPIMLIPLFYSPFIGSLCCLTLVVGSTIARGIISYHYGFSANMVFTQDNIKSFNEMYSKPWCRVGPYVVGYWTGYLLYKTKCKPRLSKIVVFVGWTISIATALAVLYGLYTEDGPPSLNEEISALYNATSRTAWGMCISWMVFACATGYGGPVNAILSWKALIPLSRLTYCAYLVHPVVQYLYFVSRKTLIYMDDLELVVLYLGILFLSYMAAFVLSLAFESPMMGLEKVLLGRKKHS